MTKVGVRALRIKGFVFTCGAWSFKNVIRAGKVITMGSTLETVVIPIKWAGYFVVLGNSFKP